MISIIATVFVSVIWFVSLRVRDFFECETHMSTPICYWTLKIMLLLTENWLNIQNFIMAQVAICIGAFFIWIISFF